MRLSDRLVQVSLWESLFLLSLDWAGSCSVVHCAQETACLLLDAALMVVWPERPSNWSLQAVG